jgi:hypothetical protein
MVVGLLEGGQAASTKPDKGLERRATLQFSALKI